MKKYLTYAIACIAAVFSLTSCFSDSDDNSLTAEEIGTIIYDLSSEYYGYLVPVVTDQMSGNSVRKDSVMTYISVGRDTTVTIYDFPVSVIADKITIDYSLKEALQNAGNVSPITGNYYPAGTNPSLGLIGYLRFSLTYPDGNSHDIVLAPDSYNYSYVAYSSATNQFYFQFIPAAIYVDGTLLESFGSLDTLYYLISSK